MVLLVTIFHFLINISSIFLTFHTLQRLYYKALCHIMAPLFICFLKGNNVLGFLNFVYIASRFLLKKELKSTILSAFVTLLL